MVTFCAHVAKFPLKSTTVQVTIVVPDPKEPGASLYVYHTPQLSLVVGVPKSIGVPSQTVMSEGQIIVGASVSETVTVCIHTALLPLASTIVQVKAVVPAGNVAQADSSKS